jgi:hypothetical protein
VPRDPRTTRIFALHGSTPLYLLGTQNARTRGIITVKGSFKLSDICDKEFHKMAQIFGMIAKHGQLKGKIDKETAAATRQPEGNKAGSIKPEAKKPQVQEECPGKSTTNKLGTPTN